MKAKEARKITYENNLSLKTELEEIYLDIKESAECGLTELYLPTWTHESIIDHLNFDLGYTIETEEEKRSGLIRSLKIKW